jgi:hypothetical protein
MEMEGAEACGRTSQELPPPADGTKALFDAGRAARVVGMNGYCIVRSAIDPTFLRDTVRPAFDAHFTSVVLPRRPQPNRGPGRYQAVLPLSAPFIDPRLVGADMIVRVLDHLLGPDFVLSLASSHVALPGERTSLPFVFVFFLFRSFFVLGSLSNWQCLLQGASSRSRISTTSLSLIHSSRFRPTASMSTFHW